MKFRFVTLLVAAVAFAAPEDVAGIWKLEYSGPGTGPRTVVSIILDLKVDGTLVSGTAHIGSWPGDAPIVDAKLDGDRITFTATGHLDSTTGIPTCQFVATLRGDEMVVVMTTIKNPNGVLGYGPSEYKGKRDSR